MMVGASSGLATRVTQAADFRAASAERELCATPQTGSPWAVHARMDADAGQVWNRKAGKSGTILPRTFPPSPHFLLN